MAIIKRLLIIQPANKTLIANNGGGNPLDLTAAKDIVRGNDSQPSEGTISYKFISPTSVVADSASPVIVTTDGVTYNDDIGGKGVDIVFKPNRKSGDTFQVEVKSAVTKKDTYLFENRGQNNFGSCTDIEFGNNRASAGAQRALIQFDVPASLSGVNVGLKKVIDSTVFFYGSNSGGSSSREYLFYPILIANSAWVEGARCDSEGINEPTYSRIRFLQGDVNNGDRWEGENQGGANGCSVSGTDYEPTHLFKVDLNSTSDAWVEFAQNGVGLNNFMNRIFTTPTSNFGFVGETSETSFRFIGRSGDYTTDKALRPKMLVLYEEETSGLDGGSPQYATSIGSEETFGGA